MFRKSDYFILLAVMISFFISAYLWFAVQDQGLRRIKRRSTNHFAIDQPVQQVQHMGLGWHTLGQGQFHGGKHGLFIVVQHEGEDIDHFAVTAGLAQHVILQLPEGGR